MLPLEGIRVLDLTNVLAGPCATHHLCCLGAEIIKVERPGTGDPMRGLGLMPGSDGCPPAFRALNAGKKSVTIDLSRDEGRETVLALAKAADVFVENFRPGVAERLGLGTGPLLSAHPGIIYCSISGWGQSGPKSPLGAYDHVIQAATGMMAMQGGTGDEAPVKVGFPVVDIATGISAAEAILAALIRRFRGDEAPMILDVSMIDSALALMSGPVATTIASAQPPARVGNRGFVGSPGADTFATADGHISVAANTMGQFKRLCHLLGRPDLAGPPFVPDGLPDDAFLVNVATDALATELSAAFAGTSARALEEALSSEGVPAAMVRDLHGFLTEVYPATPGIGLGGEAVALRPAFRFAGPMEEIGTITPRLGADNDTVLAGLGAGE